MGPRVEVQDRPRKARGWRRADQARRALPVLAALALAGCSDRWSELDPRPVVANIFGAHLEGREPPPGLDQPWPSLSSVPARPDPPDAAFRGRVAGRLAEDRAASRQALPAGGRAAPAPPGAAPPPPPRLAALPPPGPAPAPSAAPVPAPVPTPVLPTPVLPAPAAALPLPPQPAAPPPPPPAALLAPPPPPAELLAPRRN